MATNTKSIDLELSSSQYLSITDASQTGLDFASDIFSFEAWIKIEQLPSTAGADMAIFTKWTSAFPAYIIGIRSDTDKLQILSYGTSNNLSRAYTDAAFVVSGDVGNWAHIAVTLNTTTQSLTVYKNGATVANTYNITGTANLQDVASPFAIGARGDASQPFDGLIDEVIAWNDVRTGTEISGSYNSGYGKIYNGTEAGIQGYWRLENDLLDTTSNNNDLTNNNAAVFSEDVPFSGAAPAATDNALAMCNF